MRSSQEGAYGVDGERLPQGEFVRNEEGVWCKVLGEQDIRVVFPPALRRRVINSVHGSKQAGHWGVLRTAAKVRERCYWEGWSRDVEAVVKDCFGCEVERLKIQRGRRS
jgi:hypothetical protein